MAAQVEVQTAEVGRAVVGGRLHLSPLADSSNSLIEIPSMNQSHIITPEPNKPVPGPKPRLTPKPFAVERNTTIKPIVAPKPQPKPRPESTRPAGYKPELPYSPKPQQPAAKPRPVSTNPNRPASTSFKTQNKLTTGQTTKPVVHPFKPAPSLDPGDPTRPSPPAPAERQKPAPSSLAYSKSLKSLLAAEWSGTTIREDEKDQVTSSKGGASITRAKSMGFLLQIGQEEEEKEKVKPEAAVQMRPQPRGSRPRPVSAIFLDSPTQTEASVPAPRWTGRRPLSADLTSKFESIGLSLHRKTPSSNTKENTPEEKAPPQKKEPEKTPKTPQSTEGPAKLPVSDQSNKKTEELKESDEEKRAGSIRSRISLLLDSSSSPGAAATGSDLHSPVQPAPEAEPAVGVKRLIKQLTEDTTPTQSPAVKPPLKPRPLPLDLTKRFSSERSPDFGSVFFSEATDRHDISKDPQRRIEESAFTPSDQKTFVDLKDSQEPLRKASTPEGPEAGQTFGATSKESIPGADVHTVRASLFENVVERHNVLMMDDSKPVNKAKESLSSPSFKRGSGDDEGTLVTATYKEPVSPSSPLRVLHAFDTVQAVEESRVVSENIPSAQWEDKAMTLRTRRSEGSRPVPERAGEPEQQPRYLRIGALQKWTGLEQEVSTEKGMLKEPRREEQAASAEQEEVAAAPKRLKMLQAEEQPKPRATYFALTGQMQEPLPPVDAGASTGALSGRKNPSLGDAFGKTSRDQVEELLLRSHRDDGQTTEEMMDVERKRELKKEAERLKMKMKDLEREKQRALEIEKEAHLEFERMKERERQREFERQRQKAFEKEKQEFEEKQRALERQKQIELEKQKLQELERERLERERQRQLEKEKRRELERQRKIEREKQREQERERQREQERQRQREEERQRELDKERQLLEIQKEKQKMEELERLKELERLQLIEFQKQKEKEKEKERQQNFELEKQRLREKKEREEAEKIRQMALEQGMLRLKELEKERERQREMEKERQREMEREKQKELERQRLRNLEKERQKQLDMERQELENQRLRQRELEKERQRKEEMERIKEMERMQLLELEKQKQAERERQQFLELEKLKQAERERQQSLEFEKRRLREEMERIKEMERMQLLELEKQKQAERERQQFLELEKLKQAERERQQFLELEKLKQAERERQQFLELEKLKQAERERQQFLEFEKRRLREKMEREEAEKMRQIAKQQEAERQRLKEKQKKEEQERAWLEASPLRPKVVDLDSVLRNDPFQKTPPQRSDPATRWKEPSPRAEESYKPAILDIDSFTSPAQLSPSKDLFPVTGIQSVDAVFGARLQPERDVSWKVPPQTSGGFSSPVWTTSPQDPWELRPVEMSVDKPVAEPRKQMNRISPEQLLLRQEERLLVPQRPRSAVLDEPLFLTPFPGTEAKTGGSPGGVPISSPALEQIWLPREPQRQDSMVEVRSHRRSQGSQELNRMRSRSVSRRSAPSSSAVEGSLSRMRSRSAHRDLERPSWVQQKQSNSGEEEGKDSGTPVRETDSQYGTWETGLRTDDSLTPATPSSESNLSPSPKKLTPGDHTSQFDSDTVDSLPPSSSSESQALSFPDAPVALLDTSALRTRAQLGKKRAPRTRPTRAARQSEEGGTAEDWLYRDSTEAKVESKDDESDPEETTRGADGGPAVASQPQRIALFPGMDPSALKAQLKKRGDSDNQTDGPAPAASQLSRSPKSPFLPRAARVLPPAGGKENGEEDSPQWLKELKSKKRLSQYENES